jgi:hypothetical protein
MSYVDRRSFLSGALITAAGSLLPRDASAGVFTRMPEDVPTP